MAEVPAEVSTVVDEARAALERLANHVREINGQGPVVITGFVVTAEVAAEDANETTLMALFDPSMPPWRVSGLSEHGNRWIQQNF